MEVVNNLYKIIDAYHEQKLSHAFLIETNDVDKCYLDVKNIIKNINCENKYVDNCLKCNLCYQIDNNSLPNFITLCPDGASLKKQQVLELKEKMYTKPIYSKYNTYVILEADKLNSSSANTMLKFIEEPEDNIIGFFITKNKENIIDTIRSRCQIYQANYDVIVDKLDEEKKSLIEDYIKNIELDNKHCIMYNKDILMERKYTREELIEIFKEIFNIYSNAYEENGLLDEKYLFLREIDIKKMIKKLKIINKTIDNLNYNGNINLILDSFVIEMR